MLGAYAAVLAARWLRLMAACAAPCRQLGLKMGLSEQQLVLHGLPIRPIFSKRLPGKKALRKKLVRP
jgi:hypothetical protein